MNRYATAFRALLLIMPSVSLLLLAPFLFGDDECGPWEQSFGEPPLSWRPWGPFYVNPGTDCQSVPFTSRCWPVFWSWYGNSRDMPCDMDEASYRPNERGWPLRVNLLTALSVPDMPPRKLDMAQSSSPVVTREGRVAGLRPYAERATHRDLIDLITSQPLYQETDFELPFGSAVFRHIRTYSNPTGGDPDRFNPECGDEDLYPYDWFWDWNGLRWMMSENPILLIDASYRLMAHDLNQLMCYFIQDAHHSIPFIKQTTGDYVAPAWFDARLVQDVSDPDVYYVYTHDDALKYTCHTTREDVWDYDTEEPNDPVISAHRPDRLGIPYYALVEQIEDRYGNTVVYHYCEQHQYDCPEIGPEHLSDPNDPNSGPCHKCCQNCHHKGQISYIELFAAGTPTPAWTLVYTHREFLERRLKLTNGWAVWMPDPNDPVEPSEYGFVESVPPIYHGTMLHSIHAYRGTVNGIPSCPMLTYDYFNGIDSFDAYDQIDAVMEFGLPDTWEVRVTYLYEEVGTAHYRPSDGVVYCNAGEDFDVKLGGDVDPASQYGQAWQNDTMSPNRGGQKLLKATVTKRSESGETADERLTIYRYTRREEFCTLADDVARPNELKAVFCDDTIDRIHAALGTSDTKNFLLWYDDNEPVTLDPNEPTRALFDFADVDLRGWTWWDMVSVMYGSGNGGSLATVSELAECTGLDANRLSFCYVGVGEFRDRHQNEELAYRLYRMHLYPEELDPNHNPYWNDVYSQPLLHWPYYYLPLHTMDFWHFPQHPANRDQFLVMPNGEPITYPERDVRDPFHVMVIDGHELGPDGELGARVSRRAVELNVAGFVTRDRKWRFEGDDAMLESYFGTGEELVYDCCGRVIERRAKGWSVAANDPNDSFDPNSQGLIYVYEYEDSGDPNNCECDEGTPGELAKVWVKKGTEGTLRLLGEYEHAIAGRPELITKETQHPGDLPGDGPVSTMYRAYRFKNNDPNQALLFESVATSIGPQGQGESDTYTVHKRKYDDAGKLEWEGSGRFAGVDPTTHEPVDALDLFPTYRRYDYRDRLDLIREDADPSETPAPPEGFERVASDPENGPLNLETEMEYDGLGLSHVMHPNGRHTFIRHDRLDGGDIGDIDVWTFKDCAPNGSGGYDFLSPVGLTECRGGQVDGMKKLKLTGSEGEPQPVTYDPNQVITEMIPKRDAMGRVIGMTTRGAGGEELEAAIDYHYSGGVARMEGPDGTVTRNEYDNFGRLIRVFRGTKDEHPYWRTADPNQIDDDLVLVEKRGYGTSPADIDELVLKREYREKPANQYFEGDPDDPNYVPNNEDEIGWLTRYEYDWRVRLVYEERQASSGQVLRRTYTWYDNLDRVVVSATFGPGTEPTWSGDIDPRGLTNDDATPTAADILTADPAPLSLTENIYNAAGLVMETRQYRIDDPPSAGDYLSTFTFYNHQGKPTEIHTPGAPIQRFVYDAKGRQIRSSSCAADMELTRTETGYDANDRAIVTTHYERWHNGTGPALDADNSVITYTYTWYDKSGRAVATASFGTNNDAFANGPQPPDYETLDCPAQYDPNGVLIACGSTQLCEDVLVTCYDYDEAGRQSAVFHPDGTVTRYEHDDLGRLLLTTENADDDDRALVRRTACLYDDETGQLVKMAAVLPSYGDIQSWDEIGWDAPDTLQVTAFLYDAAVVDSAGAEISRNNSWISEVHFPAPSSGQPDPSQVLGFTYYSDGSVASREDARGILFAHFYDELGQRVETAVDDSAWYNEADPNTVPYYRINRIVYEHAPDGMLERVTAEAEDYENPGQSIIVARNEFEYDGFDNLLAEWQQHFGTVISSTPVVDYAWEFSSALDGDNYNRLVSMTYPKRLSNNTRRTVEFLYSGGNGLDDALSRITQIRDITASPNAWAYYFYAGLSRRVQMVYGNALIQSYVGDASSGYGCLDRFGRVRDLHFEYGANTVHRYQYEYDQAGNRECAWVQQWDWNDQDSSDHVNDSSFDYDYDGLRRLVFADMGALDDYGQIVNDPTIPLRRLSTWKLDNLGNWSGDDPNSFVRKDDSDGDGAWDDREFTHHATNSANEIDEFVTNDGGGAVATDFVHDIAGNLVFDGAYWYQYDAWNRLLQINHAGTLSATDFLANGQLDPEPGHEPGELVARFAYDGLGRLIHTQGTLDSGQLLKEDYYYDGVRRIQTAIQRPPAAPPPPPPESMFEMMGFFGGLWGRTEREYVYGPEYVDEFVFVLDESGDAFYVLQDANCNVMALVDAAGEVVEQYVYGPYGDLVPVYADNPADPLARMGHQGLFFVRLDGWADDPAMVPGAVGLYYNRNRWYSPHLGRFIQCDVNETALPIITALAFNAESPDSLLSAFDAQALYTDGLNLYAYVRSNPVNGADPAGLFSFPELLSSMGTAVSWGLSAYNAYSLANQFAGDLAAGIGLRNALLNLAIEGAIDYAGGKAFDLALRGLNAVARGARLARLERSRAWREMYEEAGGAIPDGWILHHLCPRQFERWFLTKVRPPIDINDTRWAMALDPDWHDWLHSSKGFDWNGRWQRFIDDRQMGTTAEEVYGHLEKLKRQAAEWFQREFGA